jgi:phosphoribosylformylglycinamidine cyclo-ligase
LSEQNQRPRPLTYAAAGVDIEAGDRLVDRIAPHAARTRRPEMLSGVGGFAALSRLPAGYREPVLVTTTDGVGTKLKLAFAYDRHDSVGQDLVAMSVNDLLVTGAEPLLFLDYYATSRLDVDVAERVVAGIARACSEAGCTLAGGETAEMPGFYAAGEYDLAGFCVGVVERDAIVDGRHIEAGHVLLGLASSGPHSNGYSLVRRILDELPSPPAEPLLSALLAPTRIYVRSVRALLPQVPVHGMAHITGGGLPGNVPRMLPAARGDLAFVVDVDAWPRPEVFSFLAQAGNVEERELLSTFNCGIGFVLCVPPTAADAVLHALRSLGEDARVIGRVVGRDAMAAGPGQVAFAADDTLLVGAPPG